MPGYVGTGRVRSNNGPAAGPGSGTGPVYPASLSSPMFTGPTMRLRPVAAGNGCCGRRFKLGGGEAHLVSLGDLLDRGNDSRAVMDLLMRLQEQAQQAGGRVHVVFGNHEQMNLIGDLRYVSADEYFGVRRG